MKRLFTSVLALGLALGSMAAIGCQRDLGDKADDAIDNMQNKADDIGDDIEDAAEEVDN